MKVKELNKGLAIGIGVVFAWLTLASTAMSENHDAHSQHGTPASTGVKHRIEAKLSAPESIKPNQSVPLSIQILDSQGQPVMAYERFQEALMHMIVVSDDLQFFSHLHPEHDGNGNFMITTPFPALGTYTLFCDYKPVGQTEQVSVLKLAILGTAALAPAIDTKLKVKRVAETTVKLSTSPAPLQANTETRFTFDLRQAENGQAVVDLLPYLGEKGHLVIIKQSQNLTHADYIHAHAMHEGKEAAIQFMTHFPQAGRYKLWGQFNRGGSIITADFWVDVERH